MENLKAKNITLQELLDKLNQWQERKVDLVTPSNQLYMEDGKLQFTTRPEIMEPTRSMVSQIAGKLNIPQRYWDHMVAEGKTELLDRNVTTWLKNFDSDHNNLIRMYRSNEEGGISVGRALLSDKYKVIDHHDILVSVVRAIQQTGIDIKVINADLTEQKMYVRFMAPGSTIRPESFLENYKNPKTGNDGGGSLMAGFILTNSETGQGSYQIIPRAIVSACDNGIIWYDEKKRKTHLGTKLELGEVDWSTDTKVLNNDLIVSQFQDYIKHFSSKEFLQMKIDKIEEKAGKQLLHPVEATQNICGLLNMSDEEKSDVLNYFLLSGDISYGGVAQAVTFHAHQQDDGDRRFDLERNFDYILNNLESVDKIAVS